MSEFIRPLFPLGEVKILEAAAVLMARAGQDADFFLQKHVCGIWSDEDADRNQQCLQTGSMILNRYRTLLGDEITVVTFPDRCQTVVLCNRFESGTSLYDPGCHDDRYTCAEVSDCGFTLSDSMPMASAEEAIPSTSGFFGPTAINQTTAQNESSADDHAEGLPSYHFPFDSNSISCPSDEDKPKPQDSDYTLTEESLGYLFDPSGHAPFESLGYLPNMTYDPGNFTSTDTSSAPGSTDTPSGDR
jgi:hypothetical protein